MNSIGARPEFLIRCTSRRSMDNRSPIIAPKPFGSIDDTNQSESRKLVPSDVRCSGTEMQLPDDLDAIAGEHPPEFHYSLCFLKTEHLQCVTEVDRVAVSLGE